MSSTKKTIGILGGMGPLATADLFEKITLLTKAETDRDHIRVYIDSNANIPDRTAAILGSGEDPVPEMSSALRNLEKCGADCIIMPCNTAHYFLPRLQEMTEIPFLSILTAAAEACKAQFPGNLQRLVQCSAGAGTERCARLRRTLNAGYGNKAGDVAQDIVAVLLGKGVNRRPTHIVHGWNPPRVFLSVYHIVGICKREVA